MSVLRNAPLGLNTPYCAILGLFGPIRNSPSDASSRHFSFFARQVSLGIGKPLQALRHPASMPLRYGAA